MNRRLLSSDVDGTLAGFQPATDRFRECWLELQQESRPLLCFNTGRPVDDAREFTRSIDLPAPDFVIGGVGTEIFDCARGSLIPEYHDSFGGHWDLRKVEEIVGAFPGVIRQPPENLHPYKSSWYLSDAAKEHIEELEEQLTKAGLNVCVIYSSNIDLDVLPADANKGNALRWLANRLGIPLAGCVVAGDSGNDSSMFFVPEVKGILVGNARPELLEAVAGLGHFHARREMADGVIEGLRHHGVFT
ncbi:MAG TPA: hypothetical protein DCY13_10035 [Verrucomicrobiales bacterium]|nr:hypothetical protein [Verrucomicrobiales bacterium]